MSKELLAKEKEIDEYITRVNKILTESNKQNINNAPQREVDNVVGKVKRKKKEKGKLLNYKTLEELQSLCKRAVILHTEGVYVKPPEAHNCNKKKRKKGGKKIDRGPDAKMPKTTFGSGNVGVSCEAYGVKSCTCCAPRNDEDMFLMQSLFAIEENNYFDTLFKRPKRNSAKAPSDFIDLTNTSAFGESSTTKKLNKSAISISDNSMNDSLIMIPDEIIISDDDNFFENSQTNVITKTESIDLTNTVIKTENIVSSNTNLGVENFASVDNITDYINLVTNDYDEDEMRKNEEDFEKTIDMEIKSEVLDIPVPNFANVENITDYINLVTTDYDEDAMRKYEDELAETIHTTDFELAPDISENKSETVPNEDVPQIITNKENIPKNITNNLKETVQVTESPASVSSKPITSNFSPPVICCPICLEDLIQKEVMSTVCGHLFCAECIKEAIKKTKSCPNCRKKLTLKGIHPIYLG